jgi:hypothetical protein
MTHLPTGAGPRALTQIQPQFRTIDGLSIRYAESEPRETHALFVEPVAGKSHSERHDERLAPRAMSEFILRTTKWSDDREVKVAVTLWETDRCRATIRSP